MRKAPRRKGFFHRHSLSIASAAILLLWIVLYSHWDSSTHLGSFFGNAIADWTGMLVTVLATKYFFEIGSAESRRPPARNWFSPIRRWFEDHSLTIFLLITGAGWAWLYALHECGRKMGTGDGQYCFRVDSDFWLGHPDQAVGGNSFQRERPRAQIINPPRGTGRVGRPLRH